MTSQSALNSIRNQTGYGAQSIRSSDQRSKDQANTNSGNPMTPYNYADPNSVNLGFQNPALNRYQPPMLSGPNDPLGWVHQGPYNYNLPNNYGPYFGAPASGNEGFNPSIPSNTDNFYAYLFGQAMGNPNQLGYAPQNMNMGGPATSYMAMGGKGSISPPGNINPPPGTPPQTDQGWSGMQVPSGFGPGPSMGNLGQAQPGPAVSFPYTPNQGYGSGPSMGYGPPQMMPYKPNQGYGSGPSMGFMPQQGGPPMMPTMPLQQNPMTQYFGSGMQRGMAPMGSRFGGMAAPPMLGGPLRSVAGPDPSRNNKQPLRVGPAPQPQMRVPNLGRYQQPRRYI